MWTVSSVPYLSPRQEGQVDPWREEAAHTGGVGTQRLRDVSTEVPPPDVASALNLPPETPAVVRRRTMLLDDRPVELTDSWYPAEIAAGTALATPERIRGGAVTLLASMGHTVHEAREDIVFRAATSVEAAELQLPAETPVIVLSRTCLDAEGTCFEASVMVMVAEGRHLRYRLVMEPRR
jgi:DNA-binding GntR family transcriptional regulator